MLTSPVARSVSRRISSTVFITQSLYGASMIASFTLIPIVAVDLYGDESMAGLPMTLSFMARALSAYPFGWIMDRFGRRPGLSLGYVTVVMGSALCVAAIGWESFIGFSLGVMIAGTGRAATEQARFIGAEAFPVGKRPKIIGMIVFAGTVGAVGGPILVAPSSEMVAEFGMNPSTGPFAMAVVLSTLAVLLTYTLLRPDPLSLARLHAANVKETGPTHDARPLKEIFADPTVRYATAAMVIGQLVMTLLMVITPLHMNHHAHSTQSISLVIMAHAMGMFGLSGLTGWLVTRFGREIVIKLGVVTLLISSILTPISPQFTPLALALFLLGLGWNFCFIAGSSLLSDTLAPQERGRVQGANEMFISIAASLGAMGTGVAFGSGGIMACAVVGFVFSGALGVYSLVHGRRTTPEMATRKSA